MDNEPNICFLLGIMKRSGTNFLYRLLDQHPECIGPGPIWEDFLLHNADDLIHFTQKVYNKRRGYSEDLRREIGDEDVMLSELGKALTNFLRLQLNGIDNSSSYRFLLTKTPSVRNLDQFYHFFSREKLIILVRDGRAVVESGVRSFNWKFGLAAREWSDNAQNIDRMMSSESLKDSKPLFVRYEDLYLDTRKELERIFEFLDIDAGAYPYEAIQELGIVGSSDLRRKGDEVHWQAIAMDDGFAPIRRFRNWSLRQHKRFGWIAGSEMLNLGYTDGLEVDFSAVDRVRNRLLDVIDFGLRPTWRRIRALIRRLAG